MTFDSVENVLITRTEDDVRAHAVGGLGHAPGDELGVLLAAAFWLAVGHVPRAVVLRRRPARMRIALRAGTVTGREPLGGQLVTTGVRDDVGALTVGQHDHVGGPPRRGRGHLLQVRQRAHPHRARGRRRARASARAAPPRGRDHDPGAAHEGLPGADGQRLGGVLIGAELAGLAGGIGPGDIPRILRFSRRIRHRDRGGHHQAGCGRAGLEGAQPGAQLQPAEPKQRKCDHRRV